VVKPSRSHQVRSIRRRIAAAPVRSASEAWSIVCQLISDTLERSPSIPSGSVATELQRLNGLGPALIAGGHLEKDGLTLVDEMLYATIRVLTADAALEVEENLPIPGGGSATGSWMIYFPNAGADFRFNVHSHSNCHTSCGCGTWFNCGYSW
jgi:hypothetical protein